MRLSYVLRLVPEDLADGRLVGEVEAVLDGSRGAVRGAEDLVAFCRDHAGISAGGGHPIARTGDEGFR